MMNKSLNFAVIGVGLLATMVALYMMTVTNLAAAQGGNMTGAAGGNATNMTGAAGGANIIGSGSSGGGSSSSG